jgi:mannose-6-phosphate isomerase-like protein (cupin superfamily)
MKINLTILPISVPIVPVIALLALRGHIAALNAKTVICGNARNRRRDGSSLSDERERCFADEAHPLGVRRRTVTSDQEAPKVVLRGRGVGDNIILPMGGLQAHITRKASRTETGGHWALGEAWQEPGFDNPPHVHDEAEAFYVLEGRYTFYTDTDPAEGIGPGTFVFIPPGAVHGFRTGPEGGRLICLWPSTVEAAFFGGAINLTQD